MCFYGSVQYKKACKKDFDGSRDGIIYERTESIKCPHVFGNWSSETKFHLALVLLMIALSSRNQIFLKKLLIAAFFHRLSAEGSMPTVDWVISFPSLFHEKQRNCPGWFFGEGASHCLLQGQWNYLVPQRICH